MEEERSEGSGSGPDQLVIKSKSTSTIKDPIELPKIKPQKRTQKMSKLLKNIMRPKTRAIQKYFTAAPGVNEYNAINLDKEPSPYKYPEDLERFSYKVMQRAWRDDVRIKNLKAKCYEKPSYQDRHRKGLLNRLYVSEPKLETVKTILDVDPQYFSTIEGNVPKKYFYIISSWIFYILLNKKVGGSPIILNFFLYLYTIFDSLIRI